MPTLTNGATTITLPDHLEWIDEFSFDAVAQRAVRGVTGALHIDEVALTAGRPITLQGADDRWVERAAIETLHAWAQTPVAAGQRVPLNGSAATVDAFLAAIEQAQRSAGAVGGA
jgi:hypothetical protein